MQSAVTISLVPETVNGPFVFSGDLRESCQAAKRIGFDAVELFVPSANAVDKEDVQQILKTYELSLAAVGTGAGFLLHGWHLSSLDQTVREQAVAFIKEIIEFAGDLSAPAIIGSMQGSVSKDDDRDVVLSQLRQDLDYLGKTAARFGTRLLIEPLNRYETNLLNCLDQTVAFIESLHTDRVYILADLFHMNIEEQDISEALQAVGHHLGHVHFVDSNRRPAGMGHIDFPKTIEALRNINYDGYLSAEALPYPDPLTAAKQTMGTIRNLLR